MNAGYSPSGWMRNQGTLISTPASSYEWRRKGEHVKPGCPVITASAVAQSQ